MKKGGKNNNFVTRDLFNWGKVTKMKGASQETK